jgi:hypothetical protein
MGVIWELKNLNYPKCSSSQETNSSTPVIYLIGDSHAAQWVPALSNLQPKSFEIRYLTKSSCPFTDINLNRFCSLWIRNVMQEIKLNKPNLVLISSMTNSKYFNFYNDTFYSNLFLDGFITLNNEIKKYSKVVIVQDTPYSYFDTSKCLENLIPRNCDFQYRESQLTRLFRNYVLEKDISMISFQKEICQKLICKSGGREFNYYRDTHHISRKFSQSFRQTFYSHLNVFLREI